MADIKKISTNADNKTKFMQFSHNKNVHFPLIKIGNNTIIIGELLSLSFWGYTLIKDKISKII